MGEIMKICGIALIAAVLGAILKNRGSSIAPYISQITAVVIFITAITALIPLFEFIFGLENGNNTSYITLLCTAAGISFIARIMGDICKENGENMLKGAVDFAANAEILALSVPLLGELLKIAREILCI